MSAEHKFGDHTQNRIKPYVDFDYIRYMNNVPLTIHCLQLELGCDYETADKFAVWHFKHLQHMFSVLLDDTRFNEVHKENAELKRQNDELKTQAQKKKTIEEKEPQAKIASTNKKSIFSFLKKKQP